MSNSSHTLPSVVAYDHSGEIFTHAFSHAPVVIAIAVSIAIATSTGRVTLHSKNQNLSERGCTSKQSIILLSDRTQEMDMESIPLLLASAAQKLLVFWCICDWNSYKQGQQHCLC